MTQGTASGKYGWPGRITPSPAACGPQIDESHRGSIASPAPPTPASSPGQCRMSRDPLRSVARRVRCPGRLGHKHRTPHTAAARRSTSSEREKTKVVTSPCKNEEADRAQRSAIPTAVLPGQECARSRHTRAPSGTPPAGPKNAAERDAGPPRQRIQAAPLLRPSTRRDSRLSQACGRQLIKLTTGSEACGCETSLRSGRRVPCTDSATTSYVMAPFLMPLDRDTERSPRTRVLADIAHR